MTRPAPGLIYDDDFFAWTQQQAAALRGLRPEEVGNGVDIAHVAEEIEDLGKRDLREVRSFLKRFIEHLIKIDACAGFPEVLHWRAEARTFRDSAQDAFSPSMRQLLDLSRIWHAGRRAAGHFLTDVGEGLSAPEACPFEIDELLSGDLELDSALAKLRAASTGIAA